VRSGGFISREEEQSEEAAKGPFLSVTPSCNMIVMEALTQPGKLNAVSHNALDSLIAQSPRRSRPDFSVAISQGEKKVADKVTR
jgi:hypothetical protein